MSRPTALTDLIPSRHPLIQAPMAGAQGSALALAVCAAGGVGSLPAAMLSPEALQAELQVLRQQAHGPWNVNFFCHPSPTADSATEARWREALRPFYDEAGIDPAQVPAGAGRVPFSHAVADVVEPFAPPVVSFHFGLPEPALLARVKSLLRIQALFQQVEAQKRELKLRGGVQLDAVVFVLMTFLTMSA